MLLDRDGTLNEDRRDSVTSPDQLVMIPGAAEAVARLTRAGVAVALVTNQANIGRGVIDEAALERIHDKLRREIARAGGKLDSIFICPDAPERATERRKPGPGMLREALAHFAARAADTPMIGDSLKDLEAGKAAGCPRILVRTGKGRATEATGLPPRVLPVAVYD
ncbi:MAG: HAD-IIIA family hydrolase, partial [Alphaproteobacteria bacterium]